MIINKIWLLVGKHHNQRNTHYSNTHKAPERLPETNPEKSKCKHKQTDWGYKRWYQCIGQISSIVKDKFWLLNYAANIKLPGCNTPL
jgi:hypothetical protein